MTVAEATVPVSIANFADDTGDDEEPRITRTLLHSMTNDHRGVDA